MFEVIWAFWKMWPFYSHRLKNHQMFKPDARTWKVSRAITTRREVILWFRALLCGVCEVPYKCPFFSRILWEGHYWGVPAIWGNGVSLSQNMFWLLEGSYNGQIGWQQLQELQVRITDWEKCCQKLVPWNNAFWTGLTPFGSLLLWVRHPASALCQLQPTTAVGQKELAPAKWRYSTGVKSQ